MIGPKSWGKQFIFGVIVLEFHSNHSAYCNSGGLNEHQIPTPLWGSVLKFGSIFRRHSLFIFLFFSRVRYRSRLNQYQYLKFHTVNDSTFFQHFLQLASISINGGSWLMLGKHA